MGAFTSMVKYASRIQVIVNDKDLFTLSFTAPDLGRASGIFITRSVRIRRRFYSERQHIVNALNKCVYYNKDAHDAAWKAAFSGSASAQ